MALNTTRVITTQQVQRQLLGIASILATIDNLTLLELIGESIDAAQAEFEEESQMFLWPRVIKTFPTASDVYDPLGTNPLGTYNLQEDQFDFYKSGYRSLGYFVLRHRPVSSVQQIAVQYGTAQTLLTYPQQWVRLDQQVGTVAIVPYAGAFGGVLGGNLQPAFWLPLLAGGWLNDVVPLVITIDYTAGIPDAAANPRWADLRMGLARMAALHLRESLNEIIPSGGAVDGVSFSSGSPDAMFGRLQDSVEAFKQRYINTQTPIRMSVV